MGNRGKLGELEIFWDPCSWKFSKEQQASNNSQVVGSDRLKAHCRGVDDAKWSSPLLLMSRQLTPAKCDAARRLATSSIGCVIYRRFGLDLRRQVFVRGAVEKLFHLARTDVRILWLEPVVTCPLPLLKHFH